MCLPHLAPCLGCPRDAEHVPEGDRNLEPGQVAGGLGAGRETPGDGTGGLVGWFHDGVIVAEGGPVGPRPGVRSLDALDRPIQCGRPRYTHAMKVSAAGRTGPRFVGAPASSPRSRAARHLVRWEEYNPSRRNNAPTPHDVLQASASRMIFRLYSTVNRRPRPTRARRHVARHLELLADCSAPISP